MGLFYVRYMVGGLFYVRYMVGGVVLCEVYGWWGCSM